MADTIPFREQPEAEIEADVVDKAVYVAVVTAKENVKADILAGTLFFLLQRQPQLPTSAVHDALQAVDEAVEANNVNGTLDSYLQTYLYMPQFLTKLLEMMQEGPGRNAVKDFSRAFLRSIPRLYAGYSMRRYDLSAMNNFRYRLWEQLYELAHANNMVAEVVNSGQIASLVGIRTTDRAAEILANTPDSPLTSLVTDHLLSDGKVRIAPSTVEDVYDSVNQSANELARGYLDNLVILSTTELNLRKLHTAQEVIETSPQQLQQAKEAAKTELKNAITRAEQQQQSINNTLSNVKYANKVVVGFVSKFASWTGNEDLAQAMLKISAITETALTGYAKLFESSISTAKKLTSLLGAGATAFTVFSTVAFTGGLISIGVGIFSLFKGGGETNEATIKKQLNQVIRMLRDMHSEMHVRFDFIDRKLDHIYRTMMQQFELIDWNLGEVAGDIRDIQSTLVKLDSDLQGLHRDVHGFLDSIGQRPLLEAMNTYLNFREVFNDVMDFNTFREGEVIFFSWAHDHSKDAVQAGPVTRSLDDESILDELQRFPLETNINYLVEMGANRFGVPALSDGRLANPFVWMIASEMYAQLAEEWPEHAARISSARPGSLVGVGRELVKQLSLLVNPPLFNRVAELYQAKLNRLKQEIEGFERAFEQDIAINHNLSSFQLWGGWSGVGTVPTSHPLMFVHNVGRCDGRSFPNGRSGFEINLAHWDHNELVPYMVAHQLRLGILDACFYVDWSYSYSTSRRCGRVGNDCDYHIYYLRIFIKIRYDGATVYEHVFTTTVNKDVQGTLPDGTVLIVDPPEVIADETAYREFVERDWLLNDEPPGTRTQGAPLNNWRPRHTVVQPELLEATKQAVAIKLKDLQREFYRRVANSIENDVGSGLYVAARELSAAKLLWQSLIEFAFPFSVENNDNLRSLLFGGESIVSGNDIGDEDVLLNDVLDIYRYFGSSDVEPPSEDILPSIQSLAVERAEELRSTVDGIIGRGEVEPPDVFAATLLRLNLLESRTP